jgi:hypothetical protein
MKKVYAIPDINLPTEYFGTRKEANAAFRSREQPEPIITVDAAEECNRLTAELADLERQTIALLVALKDLVAVAPDTTLEQTKEGRDAVELLRKIDPEWVADCGL